MTGAAPRSRTNSYYDPLQTATVSSLALREIVRERSSMLALTALVGTTLVPHALLRVPRVSPHARTSISSIRLCDTGLADPSTLRVKAIKEELASRGVSCAGLFEKEELVERLKQARLQPPAPAPAPPPPAPAPPAPAPPPPAASSSSSSSSKDTAAQREAIAAMSIKEIKAELTRLKASTVGFMEKSEFVDALVAARQQEAESAVDVAEGQTMKMPKKGAEAGGMPGGMGGMGGMPGGMGGMPGGMGGMGGLEDLLKGMGGMGGGGMGGGGAPGGMGGLEDLLKGMGGMGGGMPGGGMPGGMGGMPGGAGMAEMMQKMMSNPRAMQLMQKAQQNPRIMSALQDVQTNGPSAMSKYANDPEIMEVVKELQEIM